MELAKLVQNTDRLQRSTALDHVKRVQRVLNYMAENWRNKAGFPVNKDEYITRVKDCIADFKTVVSQLQRAADKEKSKKKDQFVKEGGIKLGDIMSYFFQHNKKEAVSKELTTLEEFAAQNNNIRFGVCSQLASIICCYLHRT